jgi:hypothetical protein
MVDGDGVRVSFLVYGALYVVIEMIGQQLEDVGWPRITPLDVATAVTDALLTVAVCAAVLVAIDLGAHRWRRSLHAWHQERLRLAEHSRDDEPIGVTSWRPEPLALPSAAPSVPAGATFYTPSTTPRTYGPPYPEEPARLL